MLALEGVHTYYGLSHVLQGVNLHLSKGEAVSLIGRNGAGKTTLMRTIMQLTPSAKGSVRWGDVSLCGLKPHMVYKMGVKLVPQGRKVFPKLTVEENLRLALIGQKVSDWKSELDRAYGLFHALGVRRHQKVRGLSGGERQMLAIARALLGNTSVVLMDEPTEGLAPIVVRELRDFLLELKKTGLAILLAEQNVKMALSVCDRHYILEKGEIRFSGTTEDLNRNDAVLRQTLGVTSNSATVNLESDVQPTTERKMP
jgi:branched-chain amino acid transport system ATP-binding protein